MLTLLRALTYLHSMFSSWYSRRLSGFIADYLHSSLMSDPEYPSHLVAA